MRAARHEGAGALRANLLNARSATLAERVRSILCTAPVGLICENALSRLEEALAPFPETITGIFGFESRLDSSNDEVDCFLRIRPDRGERDALISAVEGHTPSDAQQGLLGFLQNWRKNGSLIERCVRHIWLEFDGAARPTQPNKPNILFWHTRGPSTDGPIERSAAGQEALLLAIAESTGWALPDAVPSELVRCVAALPQSARVFCCGKVQRASGSLIRLCLHGFHLREIDLFLRCAGVEGVQTTLRPLLARLEPLQAEVKIDLDLDPLVAPRLHVEARSAIEDQECWSRLIAALACHAPIDPARAEAFTYWGHRALLASGDRIFSPVLSHVKILLDPLRPPEAKCYFGLWECASLAQGDR